MHSTHVPMHILLQKKFIFIIIIILLLFINHYVVLNLLVALSNRHRCLNNKNTYFIKIYWINISPEEDHSEVIKTSKKFQQSMCF